MKKYAFALLSSAFILTSAATNLNAQEEQACVPGCPDLSQTPLSVPIPSTVGNITTYTAHVNSDPTWTGSASGPTKDMKGFKVTGTQATPSLSGQNVLCVYSAKAKSLGPAEQIQFTLTNTQYNNCSYVFALLCKYKNPTGDSGLVCYTSVTGKKKQSSK
jgi:hypothetical protein